MAVDFQPAPTWADVILIEKNPSTGENKPTFNPVWLKWFVDLTALLTSGGGGSGSLGNVTGPASSTNGNIAVFNGTTGKIIKDGGAVPAGDVVGPAGATADSIVTFNGITGKLIKVGIIPGTGVATALGINVGSAGAFITFNGALGTPSSGTLTNATGLPVASGIAGFGTGVASALAVNVGSAGAFVTFNGALGTPSSGTVTNLTGTASININGTVGATTPTTGAFTTITASSLSSLTGGAKTGSGVTAAPTSGVAVTLFDATTIGLYLVGTCIPTLGTTYHGEAIVVSEGGTVSLRQTNSGANMTISVSGTNVQGTQGSGGASNITWWYLRIGT